MTKRILAIAIVAILVFTGCATPKVNPDGSPYWTTHTPKSTKSTHYEVASAKQSSSQTSALRAESAAKDAIGRWASTNVENALVTFIEEAGESLRTQQMLEVLQNLSVQTVNIALRGVSIVERYTASDGTVWVLASYPVKNLKDAYKSQALAVERAYELEKLKAEVMIGYLDALLDTREE